MNKNTTKIVIVVGIILVVAFIFLSQSDTATDLRDPITGSLSEISGEVLAKLPDQNDFSQAFESIVLVRDSQLQTDTDGRVRIDLSNGPIVRLGPNSEFTLLAEDQDDEGFFTRLKLQAGRLYVILQGGTLKVDTPQGQASVRGSYLEVRIDPGTGDITITCLEGECTAETNGGKVSMTAGQFATITSEDLPPRLGKMTDEDIRAWLETNPEATVVIVPMNATIESRQEEEGEGDPTQTPTPTITTTLTNTPTQTPTLVNIPQPTSTKALPLLTMDNDYVCRRGPTNKYVVVGTLFSGDVVQIVRQTASYWVVIHPAQGVECWVLKGAGTATDSADDVGIAGIPALIPTATEVPIIATPLPASVTTLITLAGDGSLIGSNVTFTLSVVSASGSGPIPTGSVTVSGAGFSCVAVIDGSGNAICTINTVGGTSGIYTFTATYPGDANYLGSSTSFSVTITTNVSMNITVPNNVVVGESFTVSVSVSSADGTTPTGTFGISGPTGAFTAAACSGPSNPVSCGWSISDVGSYTLTGTYSGDATHNPASGSSATITVGKANTVMTISPDLASPQTVGTTVIFSFTIDAVAPGSGTGSGTYGVNATVGGPSCSIGSPTIPFLFSSSCTFVFGATSTYTVTASYTGDANFNPSSVSITYVINP